MKSANDLIELTEKVVERYNDLLNKYRNGDVSTENVRNFNALLFSISNAFDELEKGLKGEF